MLAITAKRQKTWWSRSPPTSRVELPNTLHSRQRLYRISVYSLAIPRWFSRVHSGSTNVPARNQVRCLQWRWHESPPQCCPWTDSIWSTFHSNSPCQVQPPKEQTCHQSPFAPGYLWVWGKYCIPVASNACLTQPWNLACTEKLPYLQADLPSYHFQIFTVGISRARDILHST